MYTNFKLVSLRKQIFICFKFMDGCNINKIPLPCIQQYLSVFRPSLHFNKTLEYVYCGNKHTLV